MLSHHKITNYTFFCVALIISVVVVFLPPNNVLSYDVFGYYMYLPLQFKYHNLTIQDYNVITETLKNYHASETFYQAVKWDNGNWVMRYPLGLSIFYAPFYFIADFIAPHTKYPADGFSRPYQLSILYGCLFYTLVGLHFVKKTLSILFSDKTAALTLLAIALGTNYFFHTSVHGQGAMSHNFLFTLYAIIVYLTLQWHTTFKIKHAVILGVCIGLAALCRPSEIISGLIPLFYGVMNWKTFKDKLNLFKTQLKQLLAFGFAIVGVGFIQLCYYKYASGHFFINPYGSGNPGEGLEIFKPHVLKVLFSFRKGWFIYTPLMIFIVCGFWFMFKKNKTLFISVLAYSLLSLYIVSSWSCWWFGSCFGNRALVASYAVLFIPLGYFVDYFLNSKLKYFYILVLGLFIGLNLFQSWQMREGILDTTNMSRAYYFSTFLQTTPPTHEQSKLLLRGKSNTEIESFTKDDSLTHKLNFFRLKSFENRTSEDKSLFATIHHSGNYSLPMNIKDGSGCCLTVAHCDATQKSYTWIKASVWVYSNYPADSLDASFKINMIHNKWEFKPVTYKLSSSNFKPNVWCKLEYYYLTPDDLRSTKDLIRICFISDSKHTILVDDLLLESYEPTIDKSVF